MTLLPDSSRWTKLIVLERDAFAYPDSLGDIKIWYTDIPAVNHDRNFPYEQFRTRDAMLWT